MEVEIPIESKWARFFILSGAKNLFMSLWSKPSQEPVDLMKRYIIPVARRSNNLFSRFSPIP